MRSSLVVAGLLTFGLGVVIWIVELPFAALGDLAFPALNSPSAPFLVGGVLMIVVGSLIKESTSKIEPPEGYRFCPFCSTPVLIGEKRCDYCGGLQPPVEAP
jgi:hypothetical protein